MRRWIGAVGVTALVLVGCGSDAPGAGGGSSQPRAALQVVTTTTVLTDLVRNIGGPEVEVYGVLKANVDPHDYEPTAADLKAIAEADVVVENGVGLEKWFEETIDSAEPHGTIVDASVGITLRMVDEDGDGAQPDPHIWHDPDNAKTMVATIAAALEAADPADAALFRANLAAYSAQLDQLDATISTEIGELTNKRLVTNHDAFGYFIDHYGLQYVGAVIPSFDTQAELSPGDVNELVAKIKAEGVKAIFAEGALPPKTAAAIAEEAGVEVVDGEDALYGDALGPPGSDGDTYLKMEAHNARVIIEHLR